MGQHGGHGTQGGAAAAQRGTMAFEHVRGRLWLCTALDTLYVPFSMSALHVR